MPSVDENMLGIMRLSVEAQAMIESLYMCAPECSEGQDSTGLIKATVSRDGSLSDLWVRFDWERHIAPDDLGDNIMEAVSNAYVEQLESIARSPEKFEPPTFTDEEIREHFDAQVAEVMAGTDFGPTISPSDAAEDAIMLMQSLEEDPTAFAGKGRGSSSVRVDKQGGRVISIHVDGSWARGKSSGSIVSAVTSAASFDETSNLGDDLLFSMLSTLKHMTREG